MDKLVTASAAVSDTPSGSTIVLPGPGITGFPALLVAALRALPAERFTLVCPGPEALGDGVRAWLASGQVARLIIDEAGPEDGRIEGVETEYVAPALLGQRLQAAAAGAATFLAPVGTYARPAADGSGAMFFGGDEFGPVPALVPDLALVRAAQGDAKGNAVFADALRERALTAAKAARRTLAEVDELLPVLHPRHVQLPARYVTAVVEAAKVRG
ncbi:CoA-transferase [Streptomyces indicus]|uniref:3-oxoacid CoA-transferase subunit A/3-oxoadipate CoA-transferase, alpha subunit n=1 Tax=Streptomyces indicus TaxID=417292 RepID=A0A1G8ZLL5_9ACTN|nr:CoA-transferase [Streptomyces indicus]SDK15913.1 3-oxoacid CoA-transferase subunit A/3-oxoadipate CoA-transferase, alpha subunit [Streptomyces indicus]